MTHSGEKLRLEGFNNISKTLSVNVYDVGFAVDSAGCRAHRDYVADRYNAGRLTRVLEDLAAIIGATVLNTAQRDYDPHGASAAMLVAEGGVLHHLAAEPREAVVGHLDKSHITIHTYPESPAAGGVASLRTDIDVATCGQTTPLKALDYLLTTLKSDVVILDYRVRGFTRDDSGRKHFMDHAMGSIQDFVEPETLRHYTAADANNERRNIFHTRMALRRLKVDDYIFGARDFGARDAPIPFADRSHIRSHIRREMDELLYADAPVGRQ